MWNMELCKFNCLFHFNCTNLKFQELHQSFFMLRGKAGNSRVCSNLKKTALQDNAAKARAVFKDSKMRLNSQLVEEAEQSGEETQKRRKNDQKNDNVVNISGNGNENNLDPPGVPNEIRELGGEEGSDNEIMPHTEEKDLDHIEKNMTRHGFVMEGEGGTQNVHSFNSLTEQLRFSIENVEYAADYDGLFISWNMIDESFPQVSKTIEPITLFAKVWNLDVSCSKLKNGDRIEKYQIGSIGGKNIFLKIYVPEVLNDTNLSYFWVRELFFIELFQVGERNRSGLCGIPCNWGQVGNCVRFGIAPEDFNEVIQNVSKTWMKFFDTSNLNDIEFDFKLFVRKLKRLVSDERLEFLSKDRKCPHMDLLNSTVYVDPKALISLSIEEFGQKSPNIGNLASFLSCMNTETCQDLSVDFAYMSRKGFQLLSSPLNLRGVCKEDICIPFCDIVKKNEIKEEFDSLDPLDPSIDVDDAKFYGIPINVWGDKKSIPIPKEGGSDTTSNIGIITKLNWYASNKGNLVGNGLQTPFSGMLNGLSRFVKHVSGKKTTNPYDCFDMRMSLLESGVMSLLNSLNTASGRFRMEFSVSFAGNSMGLNDLLEVAKYLCSNWYVPCERILTDTSDLSLPFISDIAKEMDWMITETHRIKNNFIDGEGCLDDLALLNFILKVAYLFYSDHPKWVLVVQKMARIMTLEGSLKKTALIADLKGSIVLIESKRVRIL